MSEEPKRRGPKPKPPSEVRRNNFTFRIRDEMRGKLIAASEKSGRPMSEEAERRIEMTFLDEEMFGGVNTQRLGRLISAAIFIKEKFRKQPWDEWPRFEVREDAIDAIEAEFRRSERWITLPKVVHQALIEYRDSTTGYNSSLETALLNVIRAGLTANGHPVSDRSGDHPDANEWVQLERPR
jgi:hypothetical protein